MKYKAYLEQKSEGCDYSIACGQKVISIDAINIEEAKEKLTTIIIEEYSHDEYLLEYVEIYEINEVFKIDIIDIYKRRDDIINQNKLIKMNEFERIEYERLKQKFG